MTSVARRSVRAGGRTAPGIGVMVGGPTLVDVIAPAEPDTARRPFRSGRVRHEEHVGRR
ncbi:hypothetical protein ACFYW1_31990 [Streptomyces sp. NPDC002669]|uniref:hypothetical protein n=1 Tax=Streptomyces sp. NPDC002669 TaxID=3364658 RepID=UPI0036A21AAB